MKKNRILFFFSLLFVMISCKEDTNKRLGELSDKTKVAQNKILLFEFPDTVKINKLIDGKLRYNTDDIKDSDFDERYIFLHITTNQNKKDIPLEKMTKISNRLVYEDTIGDGWLPFQAVFTKTGESTLHCLIEDIIVLDNQLKGDKVKATTIETLIAKDVYVVQE